MQREAAFLEGARRSGAMDTLVAHCMVDALRGRPCLLHDDVSGFGEEPLAFCGQVPVAGDLRGVQLPGESDAWTEPPALASRTDGLLLMTGLILVVALPAPRVGKEARITLTREQMARLRSPHFLHILHCHPAGECSPVSKL